MQIQPQYEDLEIYVQCRNLKNMDIMSKSDPQVLLYEQNHQTKKWEISGKTEFLKDTLNPNFVTTFKVKFMFETQQNLKFEVIDIDDDKQDSRSFDVIGSCETSVGELFGAIKQTSILDLKHKQQPTGKIILRVDKHQESNTYTIFDIRGIKIKDVRGWFGGKICPYLKFYKQQQGKDDEKKLLGISNQSVVYVTPPQMHTQTPKFPVFELANYKLCNSDPYSPITLELWDYHSSKEHIMISSQNVTLSQLLTEGQVLFKNGDLLKVEVKQVNRWNMSDYIRGGMQLGLVCCVDFTGSNGNPYERGSLHYIHDPQNNQYRNAIISVVEILINYDYDKIVPCYGFGGYPPNSNQVSHCFPLTLADPNVFQVQGVLQAYDNAVRCVKLAGPTLFEPIIQECLRYCTQLKMSNSNQYQILLIITDGEICDMQQTKKAIVDCCDLPMSIIIIGVGNADFSKMIELDGDDGLIDHLGRRASRDLVQFVAIRDCVNYNQNHLAEQVLKEVPSQVVQYYQRAKIDPFPKQEFVSDSQIKF